MLAFESLDAFATYLRQQIAAVEAARQVGLTQAAGLIQAEAQAAPDAGAIAIGIEANKAVIAAIDPRPGTADALAGAAFRAGEAAARTIRQRVGDALAGRQPAEDGTP